MLRGLGHDPEDPSGALARIEAEEPRLRTVVEPMLGVTLTPTMSSASSKMNVIPSRAQVRIDCRVPPGLGEDAVWRRIRQVLGEPSDELRIDFTEEVVGNASGVQSELMTAIEEWITANDPGARARCRSSSPASRTRAGFARRSPTAWPTASSPSATRRC